MAEDLDDGEFWLPPQFLDDDVSLDAAYAALKPNSNALLPTLSPNDLLFPSHLPHHFRSSAVSSDPSSPVESLVGSSETESDEEERSMPDFTRPIARTPLQAHCASAGPKEMILSGSPQSTLCAFGSGRGGRKGSSNGSPISAGKVSSPTATWDILHAAAGEVEKMKLSDEAFRFNHNQRPLSTYPLNLPVSNPNTPDFSLTHRPLSHQQLQLLRFQLLREQHMAKLRNSSFALYQQRRSNLIAPVSGRNSEISGPRNACPVSFPSPAWPQLAKFQAQTQQFGSGMRAVFLEDPSGKKRECAGTGVFLPRRVDNPSEPKRKPACSTVLVPDRVAQALNLKLDNMSGQPHRQEPPRFNMAPNMDSEAAFPKLQRNQGLPHQKRSLRPQPPVNHDLRLPQEWTY